MSDTAVTAAPVAPPVVSEEADSATISNNASTTRTTSTATTSAARLQQPVTTTTTRSDQQANISSRESFEGDAVSSDSRSNGKTPHTLSDGQKKPVLPDDVSRLTPEQFSDLWQRQESYTSQLEHELSQLREGQGKLRDQLLQATRRENILILRLASKDKVLMDLKENSGSVSGHNKQKNGSAGGAGGNDSSVLQKALVDPAVNLVFDRMRKEVDEARSKVSEMESELSAWKFTPDSTTGKRLMAKCRLLYQENEELGKMISSGKVAKLEGELALQKNFAEEIKKSQSEIDDFLVELDEDFEGMQSTILGLQTQLKQVKDQLLSFQTNMFKSGDQRNGSSEHQAVDPAAETSDAAATPEASSMHEEEGQKNGVKRTAAGEAEDLRHESRKRSKSEVLAVEEDDEDMSAGGGVAAVQPSIGVTGEDSDAIISCSIDSSSIVDSSEATAAQ